MFGSVATAVVFAMALGLIIGWVSYPTVAIWVRGHQWRLYMPLDEPKPRRVDPYTLVRNPRSEGLRQIEIFGQRLRFSMLLSLVSLGILIGLVKLVDRI